MKIDVQVCDLVKEDIPQYKEKADFAFLIFVLSAISPENYIEVLTKIYNVFDIQRNRL